MYYETELWPIAVDVIGACFAGTIFLYPSIFAHELGHILAAKLVGLRPTHLIVGESEILFQRNIRGVKLIICLIPFRGLAIVEDKEINRFQTIVFVMAGPAANIGVAALMIILWPYVNFHLTLGAIFVIQTIIAFGNLIPQDYEFDGHYIPSDGKRIISCFYKK